MKGKRVEKGKTSKKKINSIRKFDVKLRKVGNSHVITIPSDFVERFELDNGDFLVIEVNGKKIKQNLKNE
tara:strand:- start:2916 stop:3125 length:210 start_codon:yes stop_codon:yes gene_type:complete